jgi:hypothetical protein
MYLSEASLHIPAIKLKTPLKNNNAPGITLIDVTRIMGIEKSIYIIDLLCK